jgi:hypothetical protein
VSVEYMAGCDGRLPSQGITGPVLIRFVTSLAVALVMGIAPARAQGTGAAPPPAAQPPPLAEPAEKFPGQPLLGPSQQPPLPQQPDPPPQHPTPPKWPGLPLVPPYPNGPGTPTGAAYPPPPAPPGDASAAANAQTAYPPPPAGGYAPPPAYPTYPAYPYPSYPAYPAYPAPAPGAVPTLSGSQTPPPPSQAPGRPFTDPQADRVVLLPTATTQPAGTFYVSNYELVIFQAGYAFTDSTQLSLTAIPAPRESFTIVDVSLKSSLYRGGLVRAAAIGSVSGAAGKDIGLQLLGRAGGVVQVCTARRCDSSLSLSTNVMLAGALLIMVNGAGGIWRMSEHVSVLAELATMVPVGTQGGQFNGALLGGGIRLSYPHWGFDFSALHVLDSTSNVSTLPFIAMTWRP